MPRPIILSIRLSRLEFLTLQQHAAAANQTVSGYIRTKLDGKAVQGNALLAHDLAQLCIALERDGMEEWANAIRRIVDQAQV